MFVAKIDSTNSALSSMLQEQALPDGFTLYTYHQTQGRGQRGNHWESEPGKNLLLSLLIRPIELTIDQNFLLSEVVALAVKKTLDQHCNDISIKWPNDIYWKDKKIAGILIENTWMGKYVNTCIAGIGLNINQTHFHSDAPNPISLKQITGKEHIQENILKELQQNIAFYRKYLQTAPEKLQKNYHEALYRKEGFHRYEDKDGTFLAKIKEVKPDGQLLLLTTNKEEKGYYFKEVKIVS